MTFFITLFVLSQQFVMGSVLSVILGIAGLAYTLDHGIYKSDLTPWLEERFFVLFHEMDHNERSARILRIIQEDVNQLICLKDSMKDLKFTL